MPEIWPENILAFSIWFECQLWRQCDENLTYRITDFKAALDAMNINDDADTLTRIIEIASVYSDTWREMREKENGK